MALTGTHIACTYVGALGSRQQVQSLVSRVLWSQTMASPGSTTQTAPGADAGYGEPAFEVRSSSDIYVSVGANPNASTGPRLFVPANETRNFFCEANDKLAWVLA